MECLKGLRKLNGVKMEFIRSKKGRDPNEILIR
jgi:hypothetical protein